MYEIFAKLMQEKGLTPYQVSKATGVSQGSLSDWKNNKSRPKYDKMLQIADFFNVRVEYLLGESVFRTLRETIDYWGNFDPFFDANFDFGGIIRTAREAQDISLDVMSAGIGITKQDLEECEEGILPINRDLADKMAAFLGTDVPQLLFDNNLYPDEVPEEYHDKVAEWEKIRERLDNEANAEHHLIDTKQGFQTERKLKLLARHLDKVPDEQRERLLKNFEDSIDIYLDAMGIPKEDE